MTADRVHLVRHGEVHNPTGVLYGRLPGFGLSARGRRMAAAAAESFEGRAVTRLVCSPLQRTQESAEPWTERFLLTPELEDRVLEPTNQFEGLAFGFGPRLLLKPGSWYKVRDPRLPSWGEPYAEIVARMMAAIEDIWRATPGGEAIIVTHQLPIWMVHRHLAGLPLRHDPRKRRCSLSSITSLERRGDGFAEIDYQEPAAHLLASAIDEGAV